MTLLGAGVAYLYYTPVLRRRLLSNCQNFPFKKRGLAGPVFEKNHLP